MGLERPLEPDYMRKSPSDPPARSRKTESDILLNTSATPTPYTDRQQNSAYQAYVLLQYAFVLVPLIAGLDKFSNILVNWSAYLATPFHSVLGITANTFMYGIGVIEIILAVGVALRPRLFGNIVGVYMIAIIFNLLIQGMYFDIALHDIGLAMGAFALSRLAQAREIGQIPTGTERVI